MKRASSPDLSSRRRSIPTAMRIAAFATLLVMAGAANGFAVDPALRCQAAIERGGVRYARAALGVLEDCTRPAATSVAACFDDAAARSRLDAAAPRWRDRVVRACESVDIHALGYLDSCGPAESACAFSSAALDASGPRNDLIDCLSCKLETRLRDAVVALAADRPANEPCRRAVVGEGVDLLSLWLRETSSCLRDRDALSIAGCLSDPRRRARFASATDAWRAAAERGCVAADPFAQLGYPALCSGVEPVVGAFCSDAAPPCGFVAATRLSAPGGDNDLLDCLDCRVSEAAIGVARDLFGAALCCDARGCRSVRSRRSCRAAGGYPIFHRVDVVPGVPAGYPHDLVVASDGTLWVPDRIQGGIWRAAPGKPPVYEGLAQYFPPTNGLLSPDGLALDAAGRPVISFREQNHIRRLESDGSTTPVALTGFPGHSGDGGPALRARSAGTMGIDFDSRGTLYFTESGLLAFAFQGAAASGEFVRAVDVAGRIHTVAGVGSGSNAPTINPTMTIPYGLAVRADDSILIGEAFGQRLLELDPGGRLTRLAGRPGSLIGSYSGDGGPAIDARFHGIEAVAVDQDGNALLGDFRNGQVRLVDRLGSVISILGRDDGLGRFLPLVDGAPASQVWGGCPGGVDVAADGRIYIADGQLEVVRVLTPTPY